MIRYEFNQHIRRPADQVYDFVVERQPENHPKWEPEVLELRRDGPVKVGTRGVMVRKDFGKVQEVPIEILEVVPGRMMRECSDGGGVKFDMRMEMLPKGNDTHLKVNIE